MLLLERVAVFGPQRHHRRHVHLVEGGQHRGGVLRLLQPRGDGAAQAGHLDPLLARLVLRAAAFAAGAGAGGRARAVQEVQHVALGDAAVLAGAGADIARRDMLFSSMILAAAGNGACAATSAGGVAGRETGPSGARRRVARRRGGIAAGATPAFARGAAPGRAGGRPSTSPSTAPTCDLGAFRRAIEHSTPAAGAFTSTVTLSVSSSTRGSSAATASPAASSSAPPSRW